MRNDDSVLTETNVSSFLEAVNQKYKLNLPTVFSDSIPISQLLKQPITVFQGNEESVVYTARGSPLDSPPFTIGNPQLTAIIILTVKVPS